MVNICKRIAQTSTQVVVTEKVGKYSVLKYPIWYCNFSGLSQNYILPPKVRDFFDILLSFLFFFVILESCSHRPYDYDVLLPIRNTFLFYNLCLFALFNIQRQYCFYLVKFLRNLSTKPFPCFLVEEVLSKRQHKVIVTEVKEKKREPVVGIKT
jgi:hypothetical protein